MGDHREKPLATAIERDALPDSLEIGGGDRELLDGELEAAETADAGSRRTPTES